MPGVYSVPAKTGQSGQATTSTLRRCATFAALVGQVSPKSVAQRRGKKVLDLLSRRGDVSAKQAEADAEAVACGEA